MTAPYRIDVHHHILPPECDNALSLFPTLQ